MTMVLCDRFECKYCSRTRHYCTAPNIELVHKIIHTEKGAVSCFRCRQLDAQNYNNAVCNLAKGELNYEHEVDKCR